MGHSRVPEATKLSAETRDPPSQDPRDHKEQPSRHDIHPDTLKQTPTKPGRNKVVRKTTAVKQESETRSRVKMTARLRLSGHTQSPLRTAFPIIILARVIHVYCTRAERHCAQLSFLRISIKIVVAVITTVVAVVTTLANSSSWYGRLYSSSVRGDICALSSSDDVLAPLAV